MIKGTDLLLRKEMQCTTYIYVCTNCTLGWSDFSFLWNFEKKQVGVVTFGKKTCFHKKNF